MSDPLERLRDTSPARESTPNVDAIKVRARQIDSRRRLTWAAVGSSIMTGLVILAVVFALETRVPIPTEVEKIPAVIANPSLGDKQTVAPSGSPTDNTEPISNTGAASAKRTGALSVELTVSSTQVAPGSEVHLRLSACNLTKEQVVREFATGQRYDFELRGNNSVVWRWGADRRFTQALAREVWQPRECRSFEETWAAVDSDGKALPSGIYNARGTLTSTEPAPSGDVRMCVGTCE